MALMTLHITTINLRLGPVAPRERAESQVVHTAVYAAPAAAGMEPEAAERGFTVKEILPRLKNGGYMAGTAAR